MATFELWTHRRIATGPLGLIAAQAANTGGERVRVVGPEGQQIELVNNTDGQPALCWLKPLELFPVHHQPPSWMSRLNQMLNQMEETP